MATVTVPQRRTQTGSGAQGGKGTAESQCGSGGGRGRPGPRTTLQYCMWIAAAGHAISGTHNHSDGYLICSLHGPTTNDRSTFVSHCSQGPLLGKDPEFGKDPPPAPVMQTAHREASPAIFQR